MMNDIQRRILAEAIKYGGGNISVPEQMAKAINESPVLTGGEAAPTLFGWGRHQFEAKFRELLTRMGFERGIIHMKTEGQEMKMYFANAAKARDFVVAFNGLARRKSMGSVASVATQFNKIKAPTGTNAIVSLDLTMIRGESLDIEGTDLYEWFTGDSITEEPLNEASIPKPPYKSIMSDKDLAGLQIEKVIAWGRADYDLGEFKCEGWVVKTKLLSHYYGTGPQLRFKFINKVDHTAARFGVNITTESFQTEQEALREFRTKGYTHNKYKIQESNDGTVTEEPLNEGGVKAALEDFMYSLPKAAIADLNKIGAGKKLTVVNYTEMKKRKDNIEKVLKKHNIPLDFMGEPTWAVINLNFKTFHGESVEVEGEEPINEVNYSKAKDTSQFIPSRYNYVLFFKTLKEKKVPFDQAKAEASLEYVFEQSFNPKSQYHKYIKDVGDLIREAMTHYMKATQVGGVIEQLSEQQVEVSEAKGVAFNVGSGSGAKRRIMSPNESVVGYYSIYAQYDSGEIELLLSKSDTVIGLEHYRMRMSNAKKIGRSGKLPKNFGGKPMTLDTLYQMIMAKVPDKSKAFGLQAQVMESMTEGTQFVEDGEIEVTESIDVQTAKRRFSNFQYKKSSKTVSGDNTEFVLHGVKETELKSIFGAPKSSGGMKQWSFEKDRPLDHQFTIEFDGSDAYINSSRKGNPTVRDHIKGVFGLMGLRVTTESIEEDGEIEVSEQFRAGDKVRVPHKGKMVSGKIVRFDDGGTSKAQQHGGAYVVDVGEYRSIIVPKHDVQKEETVSEYYRRGGYRSTSYSGDPRWITAKYAGRDSHGKPFKAGERVLYFPNGKKFYTGAEAEKAWLEFLSAKGDEEGMPFAR